MALIIDQVDMDVTPDQPVTGTATDQAGERPPPPDKHAVLAILRRHEQRCLRLRTD